MKYSELNCKACIYYNPECIFCNVGRDPRNIGSTGCELGHWIYYYRGTELMTSKELYMSRRSYYRQSEIKIVDIWNEIDR